MSTPARVPSCYGHLYDPTHESCMACLLNKQCLEASKLDKTPLGASPTDVGKLPNSKKELILMVCHKFGISTRYCSKGKVRQEVDVTRENMDEFHNLDFLITTKEAMTKLLIHNGG